MITDQTTNQLFLSDCLPKKQSRFFLRFEKVLHDCKIDFQFIPQTKDIWAADFMPVQINHNEFVQFSYDPDYLKPKKYRKTISDVDSICAAMKLVPKKSNLVVDGGNVSKTKDKVIMCDKVFHENKHIPERDLIRQLEQLFEIDKLFFVPWDINDFSGHADGMVRFIDNNTVLINDYSKEDVKFQRSFRMALHNAGLDWVELPCNHSPYPILTSARGLYINYLQMKQAVIVPIFKTNHDEEAVKILEEVFKGQTIATVDSREIADEGGVLNCISWNIEA